MGDPRWLAAGLLLLFSGAVWYWIGDMETRGVILLIGGAGALVVGALRKAQAIGRRNRPR